MVGAIATLGAAGLSSASAYAINQANIKANQERWSDEINLANTQHQREVADLRLAGLNPILSTGTAGSAVPQQGIAEQTNPLHGATEGVSSAFREYMARETARANLDAIKEEVRGIKKDNELKDVGLAMSHRENWLAGLGIDDLREHDGVRVFSPKAKDDYDSAMLAKLEELRELQRKGYLEESAIKSRASKRAWFNDIVEGLNSASGFIRALKSKQMTGDMHFGSARRR